MSITAAQQNTGEQVRCHQLHIERARQGFTMCVDCRRLLFSTPKSRCLDHWTYCCPQCFTTEQIDDFAVQRASDGRMP